MATLDRKLEDGREVFKTFVPFDDIETKRLTGGKRTITIVASTPKKDRDRDIIEPSGWDIKNFRKNPVFLWGHDQSIPAIGRVNKVTKTKDALIFKEVEFPPEGVHPLADLVYFLYENDFLKAMSVGFIPTSREKIEEKPSDDGDMMNMFGGWHFLKQELLEGSAVNVPSNADALVAAQEKGIGGDSSQLLFKMLMQKEEKGKIPVEWTKTDKGVWIMEETVMPNCPFCKFDKTECANCGEAFSEEGIAGDNLLKDVDIFNVDKIAHREATFFDSKARPVSMLEYKDEPDHDKTRPFDELAEQKVDPENKDNEVHKPEETENEIRIPNPKSVGGHGDCNLRQMTLNKEKKIFAIYCLDHKEIIAYIFKKSDWTMAQAKEWVKENAKFIEDLAQEFMSQIENHPEDDNDISVPSGDKKYKERWNRTLSKVFDVEQVEAPDPPAFIFSLFERYLECKVKEIFQNSYTIPSPLIGSYLVGFKTILAKFKLKDTRNFRGRSEVPLCYDVIQLNSQKSDDFLINGMQFYDAIGKPLIVKYSPSWYGLDVSIITSGKDKEWSKALLAKVHSWVKENNFLKGEKFSLNGEFLPKTDDGWDSLILEAKPKDAIKKTIGFLSKKGKDMAGRGLLFIGPPGTGKTKTGRVFINDVDSTFIWVSSRDFGYAGAMNALSLGFSMARDLAPSILFIEDVDTWLGGAAIDLLKTEMDGIKQNKGMITILTSNYPEKLPDALLDRPGRFHHIINFELPKAKERKDMLKLWAGNISESLLSKIVGEMDGFSGAHILELVEFAKMISEDEEIDMGEALIRSLARMKEQRELIDEIRNNEKFLQFMSKDIDSLESEEKLGAVLSRKNKSKLEKAQEIIGEVLEASTPAEVEEDKEEGKNITIEPKIDEEIDVEFDSEIELKDKPEDLEFELDDQDDSTFGIFPDSEIDIEVEKKSEPQEPKTHRIELTPEKYAEFLGTIKEKDQEIIRETVRGTLGLFD